PARTTRLSGRTMPACYQKRSIEHSVLPIRQGLEKNNRIRVNKPTVYKNRRILSAQKSERTAFLRSTGNLRASGFNESALHSTFSPESAYAGTFTDREATVMSSRI